LGSIPEPGFNRGVSGAKVVRSFLDGGQETSTNL
jgi:hypothetical protein